MRNVPHFILRVVVLRPLQYFVAICENDDAFRPSCKTDQNVTIDVQAQSALKPDVR